MKVIKLNFDHTEKKKWFFTFDDGEFGGFFEMDSAVTPNVPWIVGPFQDLDTAKDEAICTLKTMNQRAQRAISYIKGYTR